ncbi:MAG: copper chaperone PCu(A)C [Gammaproteobacteria bacterium]|nr:copper chaperone PCu(A)C [Gammaproteobacteria bacterium]
MRVAALPVACLVLVAALSSAARGAAPPLLDAQDAWIRATPGTDVAAVYLTLHNGGTQPVTVTAVGSPAAAAAMIHESAMVNGQATMRVHQPLRIAPGATVRLAPGGLHIMLQGLTHPLAAGDQVPLVLLLDGGGTIRLMARVRALDES